MSRTPEFAQIADFHARKRVPVGRDGWLSFGKEQNALPANEDCLIYIPVDEAGRKITKTGNPAKSAADYVYIVMSESGVRAVNLPDASVFEKDSSRRAGFMVLSNNLLASARVPVPNDGKYDVREQVLRFPSGAQMTLPWLARAVERKLPETGAAATFAFGRLNLVHYSSGGGIAYDSAIPLILVNPPPDVFARNAASLRDETTSLYELFSAPAETPGTPPERVVEATIVRRLSVQHTIEITYSFDWKEFFKIEAFHYDRRRFAVRFAGEGVRLLDEETGEALFELVRSPKYVVFFGEFPEMAVADRVVRQEGFDYDAYLQKFMADPAMLPYAGVARRRVALI
jgi:hypothetical protein